jgi:hypothetical protein
LRVFPQVVDQLCPSCQQQGRELRPLRLRFHMGRLNQQAPGVFVEPVAQACLLCEPRMRTLFHRLHLHAPVRHTRLQYTAVQQNATMVSIGLDRASCCVGARCSQAPMSSIWNIQDKLVQSLCRDHQPAVDEVAGARLGHRAAVRLLGALARQPVAAEAEGQVACGAEAAGAEAVAEVGVAAHDQALQTGATCVCSPGCLCCLHSCPPACLPTCLGAPDV